MAQITTKLLRVVGAHHNHQMVAVEELAHCPQKGGEGHLSGQWVEEELLCLVVMEVVMGMMTMEGVIDHLPQGEMEEMAVMVVVMEMAVVKMICHHHQIKGSHDAVKIEGTDGYMWYKDHPDPQVNQDKMEGMVRMGKCHRCPGWEWHPLC